MIQTGDGPVVYVVDDDASFLRGLGRRLRASGFQVREFDSAEAFLKQRRAGEPGCAIVDLHMPALDGLGLQDHLSARHDALPLVFLTGGGDVRTSVHAMKRGAIDFLTKPVIGEELVAAVTAALKRDEEQRHALRENLDAREKWTRLTPRQREVCELVVQGRLNKQIAAELGMTERTVKAHRAEIMHRMGVSSVPDLVRVIGRRSWRRG